MAATATIQGADWYEQRVQVLWACLSQVSCACKFSYRPGESTTLPYKAAVQGLKTKV